MKGARTHDVLGVEIQNRTLKSSVHGILLTPNDINLTPLAETAPKKIIMSSTNFL